jgi:hypothetical protein
MTLEKILQAAKNSMIHGHHTPHCFTAWVKGQGYVNNGGVLDTYDDYLRQLERSVQSEIDNMDYARKYGEPGYDNPKKGILFANWNSFPRNFDMVLEKLGYAVEWSDEWFTCDCGKAIRTQPDSYCWQPSYKEKHGEILCKECALEDNE